MIHLQIYSAEEKTIEQAAGLLINNNLAIDLTIDRDIERMLLKNNEIVYLKIFLLSAKTKALLFPKIEKLFRDTFANNAPELYSIPIVQMDWKQAEQLTEEVQKV
jgi:uncharacterized protein involved in tolerance to divalent cations